MATNSKTEIDKLLSMDGEEAWDALCGAYPDLHLEDEAYMIAAIPMSALQQGWHDLAQVHGVDRRLWPMWEKAYSYVKQRAKAMN